MQIWKVIRLALAPLLFLIAFQALASTEHPLASFSWTPNGKRPRQLPPTCSTDLLSTSIAKAQTPSQRQIEMANYFKNCKKYLEFLGDSGLSAIIQQSNIDYNYLDNKKVKTIEITLPTGIKISGIIALQDRTTRRPFIVIQCGIVCDSNDSSSQRWPLMHLFDESRFNVLILGSSTSAEFGIKNKMTVTGGYQEGIHLYQIAQWLKSEASQLNNLISSLHVIGLSLGGSGALYSALYNDNLPHASNDSSRFQSALAICPVVNLEASMNNVLGDSIAARFLQNQIWKTLQRMFGKVPIIDRLLPDKKRPNTDKMKQIVVESSLEFHQEMDRVENPDYIFGSHPKTKEDFWADNEFQTFAELVKTPTFLWSSSDDPVVLPIENSLTITQANHPDSPISVLNLDLGSHCAFNISYGWDVTTVLLRSMILAYSPEFTNGESQINKEISAIQDIPEVPIKSQQRHFSQTFDIDKNSDYFNLSYLVFDPFREYCHQPDPFMAGEDDDCFERIDRKVPIKNLGISFLDIPRNEASAEAMTRWANANLRVRDINGKDLVDSPAPPYLITWSSLSTK